MYGTQSPHIFSQWAVQSAATYQHYFDKHLFQNHTYPLEILQRNQCMKVTIPYWLPIVILTISIQNLAFVPIVIVQLTVEPSLVGSTHHAPCNDICAIVTCISMIYIIEFASSWQDIGQRECLPLQK